MIFGFSNCSISENGEIESEAKFMTSRRIYKCGNKTYKTSVVDGCYVGGIVKWALLGLDWCQKEERMCSSGQMELVR